MHNEGNATATDGVRVFIIDAYRTTLWGLQKLIESAHGTMTLAGTATSCKEALDRLRDAAPGGVILLSAAGTDAGLLEAITALSNGSNAKILVLTAKFDPHLQEKAVLAGARGVVESEGPPERVLVAITRIHEGELWINRASASRILDYARQRSTREVDLEQRKIATLTGRERQLVAAFSAHPGATAKAIANLLNISAHTARNHLNSVYEKLEVANRVELFDYARRHRLCELNEVLH